MCEDIRRFHEIVSEMTARLNGRNGNDADSVTSLLMSKESSRSKGEY